MKSMKTLVEETYTVNNATRVILMGHSMGCPVLVYFLHQQTQAWKDKYIKSLITLAGPWGGAVKTLRLMASGEGTTCGEVVRWLGAVHNCEHLAVRTKFTKGRGQCLVSNFFNVGRIHSYFSPRMGCLE